MAHFLSRGASSNMLIFLFLTLTVVVDKTFANGQYERRKSAFAPPDPAIYSFHYAIEDPKSGSNYGHQESREGDLTLGQYFVALPDGRIQRVSYSVDKYGGFRAESREVEIFLLLKEPSVHNVRYEGKAVFPIVGGGANQGPPVHYDPYYHHGYDGGGYHQKRAARKILNTDKPHSQQLSRNRLQRLNRILKIVKRRRAVMKKKKKNKNKKFSRVTELSKASRKTRRLERNRRISDDELEFEPALYEEEEASNGNRKVTIIRKRPRTKRRRKGRENDTVSRKFVTLQPQESRKKSLQVVYRANLNFHEGGNGKEAGKSKTHNNNGGENE